MAPVSRTTAAPHDIINCKDCLRVRLVQIKCDPNNKAGIFGANDENDNQINIHHASKYLISKTTVIEHFFQVSNCIYNKKKRIGEGRRKRKRMGNGIKNKKRQ